MLVRPKGILASLFFGSFWMELVQLYAKLMTSWEQWIFFPWCDTTFVAIQFDRIFIITQVQSPGPAGYTCKSVKLSHQICSLILYLSLCLIIYWYFENPQILWESR